MPRARTGSLAYKRTTGWNARVWAPVRVGDAVREERRWVPLGTHDKDLAKRKLTRIVDMLAKGELVADAAPAEAARAPTVAEAVRDYCKRRKAAGVAMADSELGYAEHHIIPEIGPMLVGDVGKVHIKSTLRAANANGKSKGMIGHLRRFLSRFFKSLEVDEIIPSNPVRLVALADVGRMKQDKRPFTLPTDDEIAFVFASPEVDVEIKLVILVARTLGGARGAEVNRWDWSMVDRDTFVACVLQRAKGDDVQDFLVPEALRPFLRAWWEGHGCPSSGPVFPVGRGLRRGEARGKSAYAGRVRRAFWKAGARRHELHEDTPHSRKLNFHSTGRRAFASALARVGVNEQTAMALTHHADSRTHKRYQLAQIREVPLAALPQLGATTAAGWASSVAKRSKRTGTAVPNRGLRGDLSVERETGFEPATSSLGSVPATAESRVMLRDATAEGPRCEVTLARCSAVSPPEKAPASAYSGDAIIHAGEFMGH